MAISEEDYKLPNVTVLWGPKNTSFAIYLDSRLVYSQTKGRAAKPEVHFERLAQEGRLPKRIRWRAYDAFPSTLAHLKGTGDWPETTTLLDVLPSAGSLRVWSLE